MRGSKISLCFRTATLAIASTVFMAGAQQQSGRFQVSDNTAGGSAFWFSQVNSDSGSLVVNRGTDPVTNSPATLMDLNFFQSNFFLEVFCFAPASALSSKTNDSVSFQVADINTCDGGRIVDEFVEDCTSGTCIFTTVPHWSANGTWTKRGVRTVQRSGTTKTVQQDPFSGKILFSSQTSGIQTFYDAPFVVDVNGDSNSGLGSINFSKGVTISFTPN
jgi:hypothetical protein